LPVSKEFFKPKLGKLAETTCAGLLQSGHCTVSPGRKLLFPRECMGNDRIEVLELRPPR
jgi:hypothetical protein